MVVILWDSDGRRVEADFPSEEPQNLFEELTSSSDPFSAGLDVKEFINEVEAILGKEVAGIYRLGYNHFWVFNLTCTDSSSIIARILRRVGKTSPTESERKDVQRECVILQWLNIVSGVPVPRMHHVNVESPFPYMLTSKCSGTLLSDSFGALPEAAKVENVRSFARIALDMFGLPVPQKIGSISSLLPSGEAIIGDIIPGLPGTKKEQFETTQEYFQWLLSCRKNSSYIGETPADIASAGEALAQLESFVLSSLDKFEPSLFRTAFVHDDFMCHNVFIDANGRITGVIDWELHSVKPLFLAASYPTWLRYDGSFKPSSAEKGGQFSSFWMASPSEAQTLRDLYDSIVRDQNPEYFRALKAGVNLRIAEEMLLTEGYDVGCSNIQEWLHGVKHVV